MTKLPSISPGRRLCLANLMLAMNFVSLSVGVILAVMAGHDVASWTGRSIIDMMWEYYPHYDPPVGLIELIVILIYERPIRRALRKSQRGEHVRDDELEKARRRLLNEPYFLMLLNTLAWLGAGVVYLYIFKASTERPDLVRILAMHSILTAVISLVATFFLLQGVLQRYLAPHFFPNGGISSVKGVYKGSINHRLSTLALAIGIAPLLIISIHALEARMALRSGIPLQTIFDHLTVSLTIELILFAINAVALTTLVALNTSRPLKEIITVVRKIKNNRLDRRVRVVTNDEIGFTGDAINEMAEGLQERERLQQSINLAKEIQQSLLPGRPPDLPGIEIAGISDYCDETGGDYYDFIPRHAAGPGASAVIVADVSGHGISSALMMSSIRAYFRAEAENGHPPAEIVRRVNRLVAIDAAENAQFATLFYLEIRPAEKSLTWVRAGHDPASLYFIDQDRFENLDGTGIAIGIDPDWIFEEFSAPIQPGAVAVLTTDGVFETTNEKEEMFGRDRFLNVIRQNANLPAEAVNQAVLDALSEFRGRAPSRDDVTLVTIKFSG